MPKFDSILESQFYDSIITFLEERQLQGKYDILSQPTLSNYSTENSLKYRRPDFLILRGIYPYIIVEVRRSVKEIANRNYIQNAAYELELIGADYFIITNLDEIIVIDSVEKKTSLPKQFDSIFHYFKEDLTSRKIEDIKRKIVNEIIKISKETKLSKNKFHIWGKRAKNILLDDYLFEKISYNQEGRFFHFITNPNLGLEDFENQFFQALLKPVTERAICRYTTFDSLYHMINNKTFRMGSDIAMNDRGEIDYVDKYIGLFYKPLQGLSLSELQQMNNSYISSCTRIMKEDDLTMYRLYAEDTKGVCLCFNVTNDVQSKYMLIKRISYAKGIGNHPELDIIKNIINTLSSSLLIRFRFLYLDVWKHFFKTHDYAIEDEVRLLYFDNSTFPPKRKGWVVTLPDKILSKYVIFDFNSKEFPLSLSKIILGPNCPDAQLNKRQIEVFLDEQNIQNVTVENSKIESYRKNQ